jgi:hypothetical protein
MLWTRNRRISRPTAHPTNFCRLLSTTQQMKAWQQVMQPKIDEVVEWQRGIGPLLTEIVAHQRDSELVLKAILSEIQISRSNRAILSLLSRLCNRRFDARLTQMFDYEVWRKRSRRSRPRGQPARIQHLPGSILAGKSKESARGLASLVPLLNTNGSTAKIPIDILINNAYLGSNTPPPDSKRIIHGIHRRVHWHQSIFQRELRARGTESQAATFSPIKPCVKGDSSDLLRVLRR